MGTHHTTVLADVVAFPYRSRLSFEPLIERWEQRLRTGSKAEQRIARFYLDHVAECSQLRKPFESIADTITCKEEYELLLSSIFPTALATQEASCANVPFTFQDFYHTSAFNAQFEKGNLSFSLNHAPDLARNINTILAGVFILNECYHKRIKLDLPMIFTVTDEQSGLRNHFKVDANYGYVRVKVQGELPPLSDAEIDKLLSNIHDVALWLELLPPEQFEFYGLTKLRMITVTEDESLSRIKFNLLKTDTLFTEENIDILESQLRTLFQLPELKFGITAVDYPADPYKRQTLYKIQHHLTRDYSDDILVPEHEGSIYEQACRENDIVIIPDLQLIAKPTALEEYLTAQQLRTVIVVPLNDEYRRTIGLLELASPRANAMNALSLLKLQEVIPLFKIAVQRTRTEVQNRVQSFIQEHYTAIHPSIRWRFIQSSYHLLDNEEQSGYVEPIVFEQVYPLYAQADIVGSSDLRAAAITADFVKHLNLITRVLDVAIPALNFPLLKQVAHYVDTLRAELEDGVDSDEESRMMDYFNTEIHPLFEQLRGKHTQVDEALVAYFEQLDEELGIVYEQRKDYERSVARVNDVIAGYLDYEQRRAQDMIPHYFEKYRTDGVEYNIYVGQSLLPPGQTFSEIHLRNLRLWQLLAMCEITRRVAHLKSELPMQLQTAQLIFVYSAPLSIRFRMDEKRFDVEGAYNVRYEIIKKRIDKATIHERDERLTVSGKIAIVYTTDADKAEYLEYLDYLLHEGKITEEIEDLTIAQLQGVSGLRALRITVAQR